MVWASGSDIAGDYTVSIAVDRDNAIAETKENNNQISRKLTFRQPQKLATFALERAARSYASTAPAESVVNMFRQAQQLGTDDGQAMVKGLSEGWNPRKKATLSADDKTFMASLSSSLPEESRNRMGRLLEAWGVRSANDESGSERPGSPDENNTGRNEIRQEGVYRNGRQAGGDYSGKPGWRCSTTWSLASLKHLR